MFEGILTKEALKEAVEACAFTLNCDVDNRPYNEQAEDFEQIAAIGSGIIADGNSMMADALWRAHVREIELAK